MPLLYDTGIEMLPRPPRSVLSIGPETTRATLPNCSSVAELSQFINRLFNWHLHTPHIYAQSILCCSVIFLLIIIVGLIMARRIYEGKFWLARLVRRPSGVIVVPNPMLAFLIMAGLCLVIFTPWYLVTIRQFVDHTAPPPNLPAWFTLPWLALGYGLIWALEGTYFATPSALLSPLDESKLFILSRFFRRANVINALSLVAPVALALAIAVPTVISNRQWERALAMERRWQKQYALQPDFTQAMVQQSQEIWYEALKAARNAAIAFLVWTVFALVTSLCYICVSVSLITTVRRDIAKARELEAPQVRALEDDKPIMASQQISQIVVDALQANQRPGAKLNQQDRLLTQSFQIRSALHYDLPNNDEEGFAVNETANPGHSHRKDLESALFQIYVQFIGIGPAGTIFGGIALTFALLLYSKLEQPSGDGGNQFEHYIGGIWMSLLYLICAAGGLNSITVFLKAYEPLLKPTKTTTAAQRQDRSRINFKDVAKGPAHIKSTFFEAPNAQSLPMSPPTSPPKGHSKGLADAVATRRGDDDTENDRSWHMDEGPSDHGADAWYSPSSVTKLLR